MKPILSVILTLIVSGGIYFGYKHQQQAEHLADGEIRCIGCMTPEEKASFDKRNDAEAAKLEIEEKSIADTSLPSTAPAPDNSVAGVETIQTPQPESGTISAHPPNGAKPGSEGTYQWFRQGKMTWRLDTKTGGSCVAFATPEEWQKPAVASHGCFRTN